MAGPQRPAAHANRSVHWGWHRLGADWARLVVDTAGVRPGELVVDLGAGTGALTGALLAAGARVVAVELHPGRAGALREAFGPALADGRLRVFRHDLLTVHWPATAFRVVANPPFALTSALLNRLTRTGPGLRQADLVLKRSVVRDRVERQQGRSAGLHASTPLRLPRRAFTPRPPVDVAVLRLTRHVPKR